MKKKRKNPAVEALPQVTQEFTGIRRKVVDRLPVRKMPKSVLLVGYLEELMCETPEQPQVNMTKFLKNSTKDKAFVCASGDGRLVLIVSPDAMRNNPGMKTDLGDPLPAKQLKGAVELHTDFHGVKPPEIKQLDTSEFDHVVFCGWLNHIVYSVPEYSERRGVPFIHKARDKGDNVPKSKEKPLVCISPAKDVIIMYGKEMSFTDRGIIG
jgi:hypothetical protein